ncbi:hypothetical protein PsYK624_169010 [Phanerochaete sordida]|uniref:Restriction of telomere capping protein 4 n=1 Tax=Phanerochaete sordida TaxID=48140 RepID=A0A9P3GRM5_9APHY|nr:hypothetical protein PsYK624_169010 [Phanerochaete sordida]
MAHRQWPAGYTLQELLDGFSEIQEMLKSKEGNTEKAAFPAVFSTEYQKSTVTRCKKILWKTTEATKVKHASTKWADFLKALKLSNDGETRNAALTLELSELPKSILRGDISENVFYELSTRNRNLESNPDETSTSVKSALTKELEHTARESPPRAAGYYGNEGIAIIMLVLMNIYDQASFNPSRFSPLSYDKFIRCLLVPEVTVYLIQEDMDLNQEDAINVLFDSERYGSIMYHEDSTPAFQEAQQWYSNVYAKARNEQKMSTTQDVEDQTIGAKVTVKAENVDIPVPPADPEITGWVKYIDENGGVVYDVSHPKAQLSDAASGAASWHTGTQGVAS